MPLRVELLEKNRAKFSNSKREASNFFPLPVALETVRFEPGTRHSLRRMAPTVAIFRAGENPESSEDHPENGKDFPLWKKAAVIILDFFMYVSVLIWISPIPLGWALIPINLFLLTIVIGRKHSERHLAKIVREWKSVLWYGTLSDMWVPQFLEKPWVKGTLAFLEIVSRPLRRLAKEFVDTMKQGLAFAWELARPKKKEEKKEEKKEPATS